MTTNLDVKFFSLMMIKTLLKKQSCLIPVPAVAAKREGQALSAITGRKGFVGGRISSKWKFKA